MTSIRVSEDELTICDARLENECDTALGSRENSVGIVVVAVVQCQNCCIANPLSSNVRCNEEEGYGTRLGSIETNILIIHEAYLPFALDYFVSILWVPYDLLYAIVVWVYWAPDTDLEILRPVNVRFVILGWHKLEASTFPP